MPYPAGTADLEELTGTGFDVEAWRKLPQLLVMGDRDDNDSLDFGDGWDKDADKNTVFQVMRTADKQFPARRPDPTAKTGWRWNLGDTKRVLYRLPELIEAVNNGEKVWICEGEKDVEALRRQGQAATCNPGGAGKWRDEFSPLLAGVHVTVVADKDAPGQAHARQVADSLKEFAESVRIVEAGLLRNRVFGAIVTTVYGGAIAVTKREFTTRKRTFVRSYEKPKARR